VQDVESAPHPDGWIPLYHTHGLRQYMGTAKFHYDPNCRHLLAWKPFHQLAKVLIREWFVSLDTIPVQFRCRSCWPKEKEGRMLREAEAEKEDA